MSAGLLVVVVAYRSDDLLGSCLGALGDGFAVTVVDNDPGGPTRAIAEAHGAGYVAASRNLGFAAGVNLGLRTSWDGAADVLLLNPDARIAGDDVRLLQQALHARPGTAAVGPRLTWSDGRPQRASWPMPSPAQAWWEAVGLGSHWPGRRFVTGAVLLLNGAALKEIGPFDEAYFLYAEETEWQLRALRAGWEVRVEPAATAVHVGAASSADADVRLERFHASGRLFADRCYGPLGARLIRAAKLAMAARRWLLRADQRPEARIMFRAYAGRSGR